MKLTVGILALVVIFTSCGPNAQEQAAAQQHRDDSIANAVKQEQALIQQHREDSIANAIKIAQQHRDDSISNAAKESLMEKEGLQNRLSMLKSARANAKSELDAAQDAMSQIKQYHFLRDATDRANQIKQQNLKIQHIKDQMDQLNDEISQCEQSLAAYQ